MAKSRMLKTPGAKWPSSPADAPKLLNSKAVARRLPHAIPCLRNCLELTVILVLAAGADRGKLLAWLAHPNGEPAHNSTNACPHCRICALSYSPARPHRGGRPTLLRAWRLAHCRTNVA